MTLAHLSVILSAVSASQVVSATAPPRAGYALIATNNRSLSLARPDLQYADDDGAKYAELFALELGADNVTLLTEFDPQSRLLFPTWSARARAPTLENLHAAVRELVAWVTRGQADGPADVYLVFAGHGDVDRGQGYIELADGRLTARDLDEAIISKLTAARVHLILDSCNSYFMLNPRKPGGGRRWQAPSRVSGLLEKYPNVGAILSTSAEAVTYEWSELQSGIFSYELRSGLRGAADVDGDNRVSYVELAAFIEVANQSIANDLYRPKVFMRGPASDAAATFLARRADAPVLSIGAEGVRRLTLRDTQGVRLLDLNKEDGTGMTLHLPAEVVVVYEQVSTAVRPSTIVREYRVEQGTQQALDGLPELTATLAERGDPPVFAALFTSAFGKLAFAAARMRMAETPSAYFGITQRDADQLRLHIANTVELDRDQGFASLYGASLASVVAGVTMVNVAASPDLPRQQRSTLYVGAAVVPAAVLAYAASMALYRTDYQEMLTAFDARELSSEEGRGRAVLEMREKFSALARKERRKRVVSGLVGVLLGVGAASYGGVVSIAGRPDAKRLGYLALANGALFAAWGAVNATLLGTPAERTWATYETGESGAVAAPVQDPAGDDSGRELPSSGTAVNAGVGPTSGGASFFLELVF